MVMMVVTAVAAKSTTETKIIAPVAAIATIATIATIAIAESPARVKAGIKVCTCIECHLLSWFGQIEFAEFNICLLILKRKCSRLIYTQQFAKGLFILRRKLSR